MQEDDHPVMRVEHSPNAHDPERPLGVLHLSSGNLYGGVERVITTLAEERHRAPGMIPSFGLAFEGRNAAELRAAGSPVEILGAVRLSRPWSVAAARRRLRVLLERSRPDVVICHNPWALVVFSPPLRSARVPVVLWLHGIVRGRSLLERYAGRVRPDWVIANSHCTRRSVPNLYADVRTSVLYSPVVTGGAVEPTARAAVRATLDADEATTVIVQISRLEAGKGHRVLVEAIANLPADGSWQCWIVGGPQRPSDHAILHEIEQIATDRGVAGRLRLLGERSDVGRLLAAADIFCQANLLPESFGLTFVEALAAGLPVVTSAIGGATEIVTEDCGILVPPGDPEALAHALHLLLADPRVRRQLARNGPARALALCDPAHRLPDLHRLLATVRSASPNA